MALAYLFLGVCVGAVFAISVLVAGFPIWVAMATYSLVGCVSTFCAAVFLGGNNQDEGDVHTKTPAARTEPMRFLVVDDDELILDLVVSTLSALGFADVTAVTSAKAAVAAVSSAPQPFDCFLLDILMPEVDGIELCRWLRNKDQYKSAPVLMVTAKSDKSHIDRAFAAGATDYVTKPFEVHELYSRIRAMERLVNSGKGQIQKPTSQPVQNSSIEKSVFDFSEAYEIEGVPGFLSYLAFENYLLQMSSSEIFTMGIFAFKIRDAGKIYASSSSAEFHLLLAHVAEALSATMKRSEFFLAYAGEGAFVCVTRTSRDHDLDRVESEANRRILSLGLQSLCSAPFETSICTSAQMRAGLMRNGSSVLKLLQLAVKSAEQNALSKTGRIGLDHEQLASSGDRPTLLVGG